MYYKSNSYCQTCKSWDVPLLKNSFTKNKNSRIQSFMCRKCANERGRKYYDNNKEKCRAIIYKSIAKHIDKQRSRASLNYHVRKGNIERPDRCEVCNEQTPRIEGHHHDYDKALEVIWMCSACHADSDRKMRAVQ